MTSTNRHSAVDVGHDTMLSEPASTLESGTVIQPRGNTATDLNNPLLPNRVANLVSLATRSTGLAVQLSSAIGVFGLGVAKITTLSTLQLGRAVVEGVLNSASKDAIVRSASTLAGADAEANIERTIEKIHSRVDQLVFWTATGFNFTTAALSMFCETSQLLLSTLDQFFGSTDSSRAIASIIAMVRREFAKSPAGGKGQTASVSELVMAFCALAYLQRACRVLLEEESRTFGVDEVVWDVVVLNDGVRVDVQETQLTTDVIQGDDTPPTQQLGRMIMSSLPDNARVSITREVLTSETIKVNVFGDVQDIRLKPPPGMELIEENRGIREVQAGQRSAVAGAQFVFRHESRQERRMSLQNTDSLPAGYMEALGRMSRDNLVSGDSGTSFLRPPDETSMGTPQPSVWAPGVNTLPMPLTSSPLLPGSTVGSTTTQQPSQELDAVLSSQPRNPPGMPFQTALSNRPSSSTKTTEHSSHPTLGKGRGLRDVLKKSMSVFSNQKEKPQELYRTPKHGASRSSYLAIHESLQQSTMSLAETYSIATDDGCRPGSVFGETAVRPEVREVSSPETGHVDDIIPARNHRRMGSHHNSLYRLEANKSETSLVSYRTQHPEVMFSPAEKLSTLRQVGVLPGMFPERHLLANAARYMRFASAAYGSSFLRIMAIGTEMPRSGISDDTHHELRTFAHHTRSAPSSILLSSFVDPQGGTDGTGATNTGVPLVHYVSLDHESKAVVLTCRGTLGFEDVLTDMACDYDDLLWRGTSYNVHKGVHASAKRLLYGGDGRVLCTLKAALEEFPSYGIILTGHSLGGAVTSLLGIMLSTPGRGTGTPFVTSAEPHTNLPENHICLPPNRPIHVYAYGPPATVCAALRTATRGLITTIVNGNDLVPFLSLGVLHDFQGAALALKADTATGTGTGAKKKRTVAAAVKAKLTRHLWNSTVNGLTQPHIWGGGTTDLAAAGEEEDEAQWAHATLATLRGSMAAEKLVPPGEVFVVEGTPVLRRDAFVFRGGGDGGEDHFGRPARRMVLRYVGDVERRFGEVRFGRGMLGDHSPGGYEEALGRLGRGVGVGG